MKRFIRFLMLMAIFGIATADAREGPYLGISFTYGGISSHTQEPLDEAYFDSLKKGPGIGLKLGVGFNDAVAIEFALTRSYYETTFMGLSNLQNQELNGRSVAIRFSAPTTKLLETPDVVDENSPESARFSNAFRPILAFIKPFEPYLFLGFGQYEIGDSSGTYYKGSGFEYGIGVDYYFTSKLSMNAGLSGKSITFTSGKFYSGHDTSVTTGAFEIGVAFHFF